MKQFKKVICLLVALLMIFSLSACSDKATDDTTNTPKSEDTQSSTSTDSNDETTAESAQPYEFSLPLTEDPVTFTIYHRFEDSSRQHYTTLADNVVLQEMAKQTNVTLEFVHPPAGDANDQYLNILLASSEYPDYIRSEFINYPGGPDGAIEDGILINMNDLIEKYCPSFLEMAKEKGQEKNMVSDQGTIIKLGAKFTPPFLDSQTTKGFITRADWLEKYNLEVPTNIEEFKNMLLVYKENGVEMPLAMPKYSYWMVRSNNLLASFFGVSHSEFQIKDGAVAYGPALPEYKDYLEFYKWMYDNDLVDPDFASHNGQDSLKLFQNGTAGVYPAGIWELRQIKSLGAEMDPEFKIVGIPFFSPDGVDTLQNTEIHFKGWPWFITTACENPELAMQYIEYLYQPETKMLTAWGIGSEEYPTYEMVDGSPVFTDFMQNQANPGGYDFPTCRVLYTAGDFQIENDDAMERQQYDDETVLDIFATWSENANNSNRYSNFITPTVDESKEITKIHTDIRTYAEEMFHKFVMGSESLDNFDDYIATMETMGLSRMLELRQTGYDRYMTR